MRPIRRHCGHIRAGRQTYARVTEGARNRVPDTGLTMLDRGQWGWVGPDAPYNFEQLGRMSGRILMGFLELDAIMGDEFIDIQNQYFFAPEVSFGNLYNPQAGVIIAKAIHSRTRTRRLVAHWSDVVFPVWRAICPSYEEEPRALRLIVRHNIANRDTKRVLGRIIPDDNPAVVDSWSYSPEDEESYGVSCIEKSSGIADRIFDYCSHPPLFPLTRQLFSVDSMHFVHTDRTGRSDVKRCAAFSRRWSGKEPRAAALLPMKTLSALESTIDIESTCITGRRCFRIGSYASISCM